MSGQAIQFFIQMAPIAIGALFVLVLKEVRLPESGIGIRFSSEIPEGVEADCGDVGAVPGHGRLGSPEDLRECAFERLVRDELIANGLFSSRGRPGNIHKIAFEKLGILDARNVDDIRRYSRKQRCDGIRIFACGGPALPGRMLSFGGESGLLFAYLASYKLEVIGA